MTAIQKLKDLTSGKFLRNVLIVASGTAGAQVIGVIFMPVITRLYGPEAFGLLGAFLAITTITGSVSALTYPIAIVLPKNDNEAIGIVKLSIYISIGTASIFALIIYIGGDSFLSLIGAQAIAAFAMLIPLKMLFSGWLKVATQWLIRKKRFKTTAKIEVANTFILNSAKTGAGLIHPAAAVLIILTVFGTALRSFMLFLTTLRVDTNSVKSMSEYNSKPASESLIRLARKYYDFPLYRAPQVLTSAVSKGLPVLMLSAFFGPAAAGFYTLGQKILKTSTKLIGQSVGYVFYPKLTRTAHKGKNTRQLILKGTLGLAAAGILPYAVIMIFGPEIFAFIFGAEWIKAGEYARWLTFMLFFQFISRPSATATATLGLQKGFLIFELLSTAVKLAVLYAGFAVFHNDVVSIAFFSSAGALAYVFLILWILVKSGKPVDQSRFED